MEELLLVKNVEEASKEIAKIMHKHITSLLKEKDSVVVGLPGGRSARSICKALCEQSIDWEKVHIFMVDERLVPINDKDSNFLLIEEGLGSVLSKDNFHPFVFDGHVKNSLNRYKEELERYGGSYDIIVLSCGEDGHVGALYPKHKSVSMNNELYISMQDSPKPPSARMSSSRDLLLRSKVGFLVFMGESKKDALKKFLEEDSIEEMPAAIVKRLKHKYIFTDQMFS